jgi:hypothetical protein
LPSLLPLFHYCSLSLHLARFEITTKLNEPLQTTSNNNQHINNPHQHTRLPLVVVVAVATAVAESSCCAARPSPQSTNSPL